MGMDMRSRGRRARRPRRGRGGSGPLRPWCCGVTQEMSVDASVSCRWGALGHQTRATAEWTGGWGRGSEHWKAFEGPCEQVQGPEQLLVGENQGSREHILCLKTRDGRARVYSDGNDMGYGDQTDNRGEGVASRMKALRE